MSSPPFPYRDAPIRKLDDPFFRRDSPAKGADLVNPVVLSHELLSHATRVTLFAKASTY
jgi:hypothetical protein